MPQTPSILGSDLQRKRFWAKVAKSEQCWEWTGALWGGGYGLVRVETVGWPAHRLSWFMAYGPIPSGLQVLHRCDNRRCVRPEHLFLGTQADNMRDMAAKGRNPIQRTPGHLEKMRAAVGPRPRGVNHRRSTLKPKDLERLRALRATGLSQQAIADQLGVHQTTVSRVLLGQTYSVD